jgi:hypothetical protein
MQEKVVVAVGEPVPDVPTGVPVEPVVPAQPQFALVDEEAVVQRLWYNAKAEAQDSASPTIITCPHCRVMGLSKTRMGCGDAACFWAPCCWCLVFFFCMDIKHRCAQCGSILGTYRPKTFC